MQIVSLAQEIEVELHHSSWNDFWTSSANVTAVRGHWSTLGLAMRPNLIALDTGCVWGGKLTAVQLADDPEQRGVIQVDCPQYQDPLA